MRVGGELVSPRWKLMSSFGGAALQKRNTLPARRDEGVEGPERVPGGPKALQEPPEAAPEVPPGVLRAPLRVPFEALGGSFATKICDVDPFLTENQAPAGHIGQHDDDDCITSSVSAASVVGSAFSVCVVSKFSFACCVVRIRLRRRRNPPTVRVHRFIKTG